MVSRLLRIVTVLVFLMLGTELLPTSVLAATAPQAKTSVTKPGQKAPPTDISGAVTQSYNADQSVQVGMIVQLKPKDATTVLPLSKKNLKDMYGVVIPVGKAPIVLSPQITKLQQVLVATSGRQQVLVSNEKGQLKVGDYVTISSVDGVGRKAGEGDLQIIGQVASPFTGTSNVVGSVKLKDNTGHETVVAIGRIQVDVNITHNPLFQKTVDYVPGFLNGVAVSVANKPVSVARIYLCTLILLATMIISGNMLYSGVRGGMISIGRNPLSKKSIMKGLIQTVFAGLIIFVVGVLAVYLLLKL